MLDLRFRVQIVEQTIVNKHWNFTILTLFRGGCKFAHCKFRNEVVYFASNSLCKMCFFFIKRPSNFMWNLYVASLPLTIHAIHHAPWINYKNCYIGNCSLSPSFASILNYLWTLTHYKKGMKIGETDGLGCSRSLF